MDITLLNMVMSLRIPTSSVDRLSLAGSNGDLLPRFVSDAHSYVSKEEFFVSTHDV